MRYFLENFREVYNKDWPFGQFPEWNLYPSTGTHIGTDFKVPVGTQILAPTDGDMSKTHRDRYKGNVGIYIFKYRGLEWGLELCHLRELPLEGSFNEGDVIAHSGMTGEALVGAHLHAVLHRDAMVTKHYQLLKSREAFLQLEQNGSIVDTFKWFCDAVEESTANKITPQETPKIYPSPPISQPQKNETTYPSNRLGIILDLIIKFLRRSG